MTAPAEVRLLQDEGAGDLLWAHQPVGPAKVAFAVEALRRGGLTLGLDSVEVATPLSGAGVTVPFLLDVDTGLGRTGVDPDRAVETARRIAALPDLEPRGVMTHEGHLGRCAQTVLTRVVSAQRKGTLIVDAGVKAMSSDGLSGGSLGTVCDPAGEPLDGVTFANGNEEHGYLTGPGTSALRPGDLLRIIPNHACGTTNMWSRAHVVDDGQVVDHWAIRARH